jgi:collagenase-like PrtC family protease
MKKLEVLAPVGSKYSFVSAVTAGADAVYMGLEKFNARNRAQNFTIGEFYSYADYARKHNVKVYVTLNTLVKETELSELFKTLNIISASGADGIIVQDLGVLNIVKTYFPHIAVHASTQLAVHNSYGALIAAKLGFKRAVLARELSLKDINKIACAAQIELEVFVHGALCYSVSGMCLLSSAIGGMSGNRGMCAQPCRRLYNSGYYISPKDLELSAYILDLKKAGVTSLKIEGRMKNAEYVYKTVKAYKMLAQADEHNYNEVLNQSKQLLNADYARPKTTFNFVQKSVDIFAPEAQFKVSRGSFTLPAVKIERVAKSFDNEVKMPLVKPQKHTPQGEKLFIKINDLSWLNVLPKNETVILAVNKEIKINSIKPDMFLELPPYIDEADLNIFENIIKKSGVKNFILNNLAHFKFFGGLNVNLHAGKWLYAANHFAVNTLKKLGIKSFTYSVEDDIKNISQIAKFVSGGMVYLHTMAEVCISKMMPHGKLQSGEVLKSGADEFCLIKKPDETVLLTKYPAVLFNKKRDFLKAGINNFIIDLSYIPKDETYFKLLLDAYYLKRPLSSAFSFNAERGLK